jgi:hypothetical protein
MAEAGMEVEGKTQEQADVELEFKKSLKHVADNEDCKPVSVNQTGNSSLNECSGVKNGG